MTLISPLVTLKYLSPGKGKSDAWVFPLFTGCWVRSWSLGILQRGSFVQHHLSPHLMSFMGFTIFSQLVTDSHIIQIWLLQASSGRFLLPWPWCTLIAIQPLVMTECSSFSSCMFFTDPRWALFLVTHRFLFVSLWGSKFLLSSFSSVCRSCLAIFCGLAHQHPYLLPAFARLTKLCFTFMFTGCSLHAWYYLFDFFLFLSILSFLAASVIICTLLYPGVLFL